MILLLLLLVSVLLAALALFGTTDCDDALDGRYPASASTRLTMALGSVRLPLLILSLWFAYWLGLLGKRDHAFATMADRAWRLIRDWGYVVALGAARFDG